MQTECGGQFCPQPAVSRPWPPKSAFRHLAHNWTHPSIPTVAAAYLFHLCQNRGFVDGNKQVAANALSDGQLDPDFGEEELADLVLSVASGGSRSAPLEGS
jgi:Fic/DOC family protein